MTKVTFTGTTLTSKGRFIKGETCNKFTEDEAKDLQRLSTVESPETPTIDKDAEKKAKAEKAKKAREAKAEKK